MTELVLIMPIEIECNKTYAKRSYVDVGGQDERIFKILLTEMLYYKQLLASNIILNWTYRYYLYHSTRVPYMRYTKFLRINVSHL